MTREEPQPKIVRRRTEYRYIAKTTTMESEAIESPRCSRALYRSVHTEIEIDPAKMARDIRMAFGLPALNLARLLKPNFFYREHSR